MPPSSNKHLPNHLPKLVRDELHMTAALRCYSVLRQGKGKKNSDLYKSMSDLYHGKESSIPSHIKLLSEASFCFKDLYDPSTLVELDKTSNSTRESVQQYVLKTSLTRIKTRQFHAGVEITSLDLEKKNCSGPQLMSGRQLLEMAKCGTSFYRKALAFASRKFDLESMTCKESGSTIHDVIEYV